MSRLYLVPFGHIQRCIRREIDIQAGAETYHAKTRPPEDFVSGLYMTDDAPGEQAGDLYKTDFLTFFGLKNNGLLFIVRGGRFPAGGKKFAGFIHGVLHLTGTGDPVDMHIKNGHEDPDFQAGPVNKRILFNHFGLDHPAVRRGYRGIFHLRNVALRIPKEIDNKKSGNQPQNGKRGYFQEGKYKRSEGGRIDKRIPWLCNG